MSRRIVGFWNADLIYLQADLLKDGYQKKNKNPLCGAILMLIALSKEKT